LYSSATSVRNYKKKEDCQLPLYFVCPSTATHPVPVPLQHYILDSNDEPTENQEKTSQTSTSADADFIDFQFNELHRITQEKLNGLIRDLDLPKS
jgi:hypothetical protein